IRRTERSQRSLGRMVWLAALAGGAALEDPSPHGRVADDLSLRRNGFPGLHGRIVSSDIADLTIYKCSRGTGRRADNAYGLAAGLSARAGLDIYRQCDLGDSHRAAENDRSRLTNSGSNVPCAISTGLDMASLRGARREPGVVRPQTSGSNLCR